MTHALTRKPRGFVLLLGLFALALMTNLTAVGLLRSMTEMRASQGSFARVAAFHRAEAGIDDALVSLRGLSQNEINDLLEDDAVAVCQGISGCTYLVRDDVEPDGDPLVDSNQIVLVTSTGAVGAGSSTLQASVQLPVGGNIFDWGVFARGAFMHNNAQIGDLGNQVPIHLKHDFAIELGNDIYAPFVRFGFGLNGCPQCEAGNLAVLHGPDPGTLPAFQINQAFGLPSGSATTLDLSPYYAQAIQECMAEAPGHTQADCESGAAGSRHHITGSIGDTVTISNGPPINGIIYVEKGVNLDLEGTVVINGTIVHEGYAENGNQGRLRFKSNANITIDSTAGADPFAPGMAVVGGAQLDSFDTTAVNVQGYMMGGTGTSTPQ
ncbi:MAG: hypothetical protein Q8R78_03925, partial [Candidatus Omnitrophota bacterium]|nr:hypothetical protein [Candidatus Omnitrophota bacterium]